MGCRLVRRPPRQAGKGGLVISRVEPNENPAVPLLGRFLESYISSRTDVKGSTATVYGHTQRCLVEFFGATRPLDRITAGDCEDWRLWLASDQELADNTVRRRCGIAKQFFRAAVRRRLIAENPFADMAGCAIRENRARDRFITREEAQAVLDACPDAQWRLLFALSRFGGLRCPSEHLGLRWGDVDWERGRITVRSPKTEHHEGGESRQLSRSSPSCGRTWKRFGSKPSRGRSGSSPATGTTTHNLRTQLQNDHPRAGLTAVAEAVAEPPGTRADGTGRNLPDARRLPVDRQQPSRCGQALPASDRRTLPAGVEWPRRVQMALQLSDATPCNAVKADLPTPNARPAVASGCINSHSVAHYCKTVQVGDKGLEPPTSTV